MGFILKSKCSMDIKWVLNCMIKCLYSLNILFKPAETLFISKTQTETWNSSRFFQYTIKDSLSHQVMKP